MQVLPCRSVAGGCAHAHARLELAEGGFRRLAVLAPARGAVVIEAAAPSDALPRRERRRAPLPPVARHVVDAEWAPRARVEADGVRSEGKRLLAVGLVEVGVLGLEEIAVRIPAVVRAASGALPFELVAKPRVRHSPAAVEPCRV